MDTSVAAARTLSLGLRAWKSTGDTFNALFLQALDLTLTRLAAEMREAFLPDVEHVVLLAPHTSTDAAVGILFQATADRWVLKITDSAGGTLGSSVLTDWRPETDGTWDGAMHLEVLQNKDPLSSPATLVDRWARRQSRSWWSSGNDYYVSLDRPWRNTTDIDMQGNIFQRDVFTRADVKQVLPPASIWDASRTQVWPISAISAEVQQGADFQRANKGRPVALYRSTQHQLPTPTEAPTTGVGGGGSWVGPVQEGSFEVCATWCYGVLDIDTLSLPGGLRRPLLESAPSPVSAVINHTTASVTGRALIFTVTDHCAQQGFAVPATIRQNRNGWYTRIYIRRLSVRTAGAGVWNSVETNDIFYPLADIAAGSTTLTWTGAEAPDSLSRLVRSKGYYAWRVAPYQDQRYELDIPVMRRPIELIDDADTAPITDEAFPVFLELLLHYMSLLDGVDRESALIHLTNYTTQREALRGSPTAGSSGEVTAYPGIGGYTSYPRGRSVGRFTDE